MRKIQIQNDSYYHIFGRGVDKRKIFMSDDDYNRFLTSMVEFNQAGLVGSLRAKKQRHRKSKNSHRVAVSRSTAPLVELIAYCLNQNHYHFILRQVVNNGIAKFMHKLIMGYSHYFNEKNDRSGSLFQGPYQAVPVETDEQLLYLSAYVNGNAEIHKIAKAAAWEWGSYKDYVGRRNGAMCNMKNILAEFKHIKDYQDYVKIVIKESGHRKEEIKKYA